MSNATWDVFHAERLEAERGLTSVQVRQALARGDIQDDDLIRPAGSSQPWVPLADCPEILVETVPAVEPDETQEIAEPEPSPPLPTAVGPKPGTGMGAGTGTGTGTSEEMATVFMSGSEEFAPPEAEKGDEPNETRFFQGMLEDEFDVLNDAGNSIAYPKGTAFQLGPSEDEIDAQSAGFYRNDGKVDDNLDLDPELNLDARLLGTPGHGHTEELETWDDGEPASQTLDDEDVAEFVDEDEPEDAILLEVAAEDEGFVGDEIDPGDEEDEYDPIEEDEAAAEFTLARGSTETIEELDLAAMVDVAFQLVLFFLVTATTVLYKSLEVPKPNPESSPAASATQGKSLDELKDNFILVEIDPAGLLKVDQEAVDANHDALVRRLRSAREETHRDSMLLSADFSTPHRAAVLAYDAANEIGLGIAIARPVPKP